jgi:hypothetical protein
VLGRQLVNVVEGGVRVIISPSTSGRGRTKTQGKRMIELRK